MAKNQSERERKLNKLCDKFRDASDKYFDDMELFDLLDLIERFMTGKHSGSKAVDDNPDEPTPAVQLCWKITDSISAKVFNQPMRPMVVAEEATNYPVPDEHPWRKMVAANLKPMIGPDGQPIMNPPQQGPMGMPMPPEPVLESPFQSETDNEIAAEAMTASLDWLWDKADVDAKHQRAGKSAIWYGTSFVICGYDGEDWLFDTNEGYYGDVVHLRDAFVDPDNKTHDINNSRWFGFTVPIPVTDLKRRYPDKKDMIVEAFESYDDNTEGRRKKSRRTIGGNRESEFGWETADLEVFYIRNREVEYRMRSDVDDSFDPEEDEDEEIAVPKYKGGWMRVIRTEGVVLEEGDSGAPDGQLPVVVYRCSDVPDRFLGMGIPEQIIGLNLTLDRHLKYAIKNARALGQNKLIVNEFKIENLDTALSNQSGGVIRVKSDVEDVRSVAMPFAGMEFPQSHVQIIELVNSFAADITGEKELRREENLPRDASGKFVELVQSSANARVTKVRENMFRSGKQLARKYTRLLIENESGERYFRISRDWTNPSYIFFDPSILSFDEFEFEAKWDIIVGDAANLPTTPAEHVAVVTGIIDKLIMYPPPIRNKLLEVLPIPNKPYIRQAFDDFDKAQQGQQPQPTDQEKAAMADTKARVAESRARAEQRVAEGTSDAFERIATSLASAKSDNPAIQQQNMQQALQIAQNLPQLVMQSLEAAGLTNILVPKQPAPQAPPQVQGPQP